jgi:hypothetical protein
VAKNFRRNLFRSVLDETLQRICFSHLVFVRYQRSKYWLWLNSNTTGSQLHTWITIWNLTCFGGVEVENWLEYLGRNYVRLKKTVLRNFVTFYFSENFNRTTRPKNMRLVGKRTVGKPNTGLWPEFLKATARLIHVPVDGKMILKHIWKKWSVTSSVLLKTGGKIRVT